MKILLSCIGTVLVLAAFSSARAGQGLDLYAGGGFSFPLTDVSGSWSNGTHGTAAIGYGLTPGLEGVGRISYHSFPVEDDPDTASFADTENDLTVHEYAGEIRAQLTPPGIQLRPYGLVGIGFARLPDKTEFFYCVGGGLKFSVLPRLNLFVEGRYSWVSVKDYSVNYFPVTVGVNLSL